MASIEKLGLATQEQTELLKLLNTGRGVILILAPQREHRLHTLRIMQMYLESQRRDIGVFGQLAQVPAGGIPHDVPVWMPDSWRDLPRVEMLPEVDDLIALQQALDAVHQGTLMIASMEGVDAGTFLQQAIREGMDPGELGGGLLAILTQHTIRKACPLCRVDLAPSFALEDAFEDSFGRLGFPFPGFYLREGRGCHTCQFTGYLSQVHVFEFLRVSSAVQEQLAEEATMELLDGRAMTEGMLPWEAKLYFRLKHGDIALKDAAVVLAEARHCR